MIISVLVGGAHTIRRGVAIAMGDTEPKERLRDDLVQNVLVAPSFLCCFCIGLCFQFTYHLGNQVFDF